MNPTLRAALAATLLGAAALSAVAAVDVGVGITIREPGVYGRIEIGSAPPPPLLYAQPMIISQPRVVVAQPVQPMYLYVPPGHAKKWDKHCHRYSACARPVYFVQENWVQQRWESEHRGKGQGKHKGKGKKHDD